MNEMVRISILGTGIIVGGLLASYWIAATFGHPTGVWFWRDMLGLL